MSSCSFLSAGVRVVLKRNSVTTFFSFFDLCVSACACVRACVRVCVCVCACVRACVLFFRVKLGVLQHRSAMFFELVFFPCLPLTPPTQPPSPPTSLSYARAHARERARTLMWWLPVLLCLCIASWQSLVGWCLALKVCQLREPIGTR